MIATDAYELATQDTALVDRSDRAKWLLSGGGAGEFLEGQVTNAVEKLAVGEGRYAAFLNPKGKLRADVRVLRVDRGFWLDSEGYAKDVGLDVGKFKKALDDKSHAATVDAELKLGEEVAVDGTPTMFLNGARVANPTDFDALSKQIDKALGG